MTDITPIRDYYDATADAEWQRLEQSWLEFAVTRRFIDRYLPPGSTVLDIGGGPGRYAIALAKVGHRVHLADLSPRCVALAQEKARSAGVSLASATVADARDLSSVADASMDAVLCLGPLYHLIDEADRRQTVAECRRVLRPGGIGFFAFLSRYAPIHYTLKTAPEAIAENRPVIDRVIADGVYRPENDETFFTESYFADPDEIAPFLSDCGFEPLVLFGAEGGVAQGEGVLSALSGKARQDWINLAIRLADGPAGIFGSEHLIFVGRQAS